MVYTVGENSPMILSLKVLVNVHPVHMALKALTLWPFSKIIVSPAYLICCQHMAKRNMDEVMTVY